jgi:hypothetical protein
MSAFSMYRFGSVPTPLRRGSHRLARGEALCLNAAK